MHARKGGGRGKRKGRRRKRRRRIVTPVKMMTPPLTKKLPMPEKKRMGKAKGSLCR